MIQDQDMPPMDLLRSLTAAADEAALANIRAGRGGPFGAVLALYDRGSGRSMPVGHPAANAVLATGLASAHAEDQALSPGNMKELRARLAQADARQVFVILASSAESCPACHAKIEIAARALVADGLLRPGHFIVSYGATYRDTWEVAGFNDEPYHADMLKPAAERLVRQEDAPKGTTLEAPAVIVTPDGQRFAGYDQRGKHFTLTPEVAAIYAACSARKKRGDAAPWDLGGATLYTATRAPGPLAYAECQWANVIRWVTVAGGADVREAPDVSNETLFAAVAARPYNGPAAAARIIRITPFENKAQQEWRRLTAQAETELTHYNGIPV